MASKDEYRLFIDESGNHQYGAKCGRHLGLLGVIVSLDSYTSEFRPALRQIKRTHFSDDPDVPVVFHREDMARKDGIFSCLACPEKRLKFNEEIVDFYKEQNYTLIAVVIDKESHRQVYGQWAKHPYHYCSEAILERYFFFLRDCDGTGDVIAESRGTAEDGKLASEWKSFCKNGTRFVHRDDLSLRIKDENMQFRTKQDNIYGLQLADLLVKACTKDVLITFGHAARHRQTFDAIVSEAIQNKFRCNGIGCPKGRGKKLLFAQKNRPHKETPENRLRKAGRPRLKPLSTTSIG